jgi:hypothetical protein
MTGRSWRVSRRRPPPLESTSHSPLGDCDARLIGARRPDRLSDRAVVDRLMRRVRPAIRGGCRVKVVLSGRFKRLPGCLRTS